MNANDKAPRDLRKRAKKGRNAASKKTKGYSTLVCYLTGITLDVTFIRNNVSQLYSELITPFYLMWRRGLPLSEPFDPTFSFSCFIVVN